MEQSGSLLDMNDGESVRYLYNSRCRCSLICCAAVISHTLLATVGFLSGVFLCQNGSEYCSYDGSIGH